MAFIVHEILALSCGYTGVEKILFMCRFLKSFCGQEEAAVTLNLVSVHKCTQETKLHADVSESGNMHSVIFSLCDPGKVI